MAENSKKASTSASIESAKSVSLHRFLSAAAGAGLPFAAWRLPEKKEQTAFADLSGQALKNAAEMENLPTGFLLSPFESGDNDKLLIRADAVWETGKALQIKTKQGPAAEKFHQFLTSEIPADKTDFYRYVPADDFPADSLADDFRENVRAAVRAMKAEKFRKVVLSRCKHAPLPAGFDPVDTFDRLCARYPAAFVFLFALPGYGLWAGASPEPLIGTDEAGIFQTVALAGTQVSVGQTDLGEVRWSHKEIEEQAMVSRYIINCFKKIRLREFEERGPRTAAAGNLFHLRSLFRVDTRAVDFPDLGTVMLNLLHPTSAVCGMPKAPALDFIRENENYDRRLYSGFSGPVNHRGENRIFVNLRCMQLFENKAIMYAGAGITPDSDPEKEWVETEMKCRTMSSVLG